MTTRRAAASSETILIHKSVQDEDILRKSGCSCEKCKDELQGICLSKACKCCTANVSRRSVYTGWGNSKYRQRKDIDIAEEYETIREWFLNLSKGSEKNYRIIMLKFMHYLHLNPDQFLDLAKKDPHAAHAKMKEFWTGLSALHEGFELGLYSYRTVGFPVVDKPVFIQEIGYRF